MGEIYPVSSSEEMQTFVEQNRSNGWESLSDQKKAFCHEYTMEYDHKKSAEEVGYKASGGIRLLRDPLVAAYIAHLQDLQLTSNIITKEYINTNYMKLLEMSTGQREMHIVLATGEEIMARKTLIGESTNILKEMSKSIEYAKEGGEKSAPVQITINTGSFYDDTITIDHDVVDSVDG